MADPEIPEAAIRAAAEVMFERWRTTFAKGLPLEEFGTRSDHFTDEAREVLAAALPHLGETRVVLIKPGDRLVIGGIEVHDADWLRRFMEGLRDIGFPSTVLTDQDASIAVQPGADHA